MLSNFKIYDIHAMTEAGLSKEGLLKKLIYGYRMKFLVPEQSISNIQQSKLFLWMCSDLN